MSCVRESDEFQWFFFSNCLQYCGREIFIQKRKEKIDGLHALIQLLIKVVKVIKLDRINCDMQKFSVHDTPVSAKERTKSRK